MPAAHRHEASRHALRVRLAVVAGLLLAAVSSTGGGAATPWEPEDPQPPGNDLLRREIVDVALLPPAAGRPAPLLLTVGRDPGGSGGTRLSVLDRGAGRWNTRTEALDEPVIRAPRQARLVALAEHQFALVVASTEIRRSWVRTVTWTGQDLRMGPRITIERRLESGGAADVDGDGVKELVLAEAVTRRGGPTCQGTTLLVIDPRTMGYTERVIPNLWLAAGVVGELDDVPGDDLAATAFRNCPALLSNPDRFAFAAVRLADGATLANVPLVPADPLISWSGRPYLADLEGDARPEVLLGSARGAVVVSPEEDWAMADVKELGGVLLGVVGGSRGGSPAAVAVAADADRIAAARIRPSGDGWTAELLDVADSRLLGDEAWGAAAVDRRNAGLRLQGGPAWRDGVDPCSPLVVPLAVVIPCTDPEHLRIRASPTVLPGPAWFATRPLARVGGPLSPILVARVDRWTGARGRLTAPAPLAAEPHGATWRVGASAPFTLAEVDATIFDPQPPPGVEIEAAVSGASRVARIRGAAGSRVVLAVTPTARQERTASAGLAGLLASADRQLRLALHRLDGEVLRVPLGSAAAEWDAVGVAVGPLGDVSSAVRARVAVDELAPPLVLEVPFVAPPWPLSATITGSTEPGARVEHAGEEVSVGDDGSFELDLVLPPWPQDLRLRAVDRAGNETELRVDVVGGIDYRGVPWHVVLAALLVVGALVGGLRPRGTRAIRPQRGVERRDDAGVEIEELTNGPIDPVR